ncbi:MAG: DNA primase [Methylococcales bacterium]
MVLTPQWLDELRARTTLSALIGRSIKVTKAGREFKACCPFHNEKTPSFTINDEKGFYHCFGCSAHGDAIRWMTDQRGLGFMDAVKELADAAGMQVPEADPKAAEKAERANSLYDVMAAAQNWFVSQFQGPEGAEALSYCTKRGLDEETLKAFGIGFAPDSRSKLKEALSHFGIEKLVESGLLIAVDDKEPYDRFRGRLMIPIRDPRGRVIAFGGRILGAGEPKYLNSPDTPLFDKGRTLYNLDKASPASKTSKRVIVVEGYMDVIALAQKGFSDAVAPLGTALTEQQIEMLWRLSDRPIICLDGDEAGQKAAERAALRALPIMRPGKSMVFAELPQRQDPDDFLRANGSAKFEVVLKISKSLSRFVWSRHRARIELFRPGPDDRAKLLGELDTIATTIADRILATEYRSAFRQLFFEEFGFKKDGLRKAGLAIARAFGTKLGDITEVVQRAILLGLSRYPRIIHSRFEEVASMVIENELLNEMRSDILALAGAQPEIDQDIIEQIWLTDRSPPFKARDLQTDLAFSFYFKHDDPAKPESDLFLLINFVNHERRLNDKIAAARAELDTSHSLEAADQCREYEAQKRQNRLDISDLIVTADNDGLAMKSAAA